MKKLYIGLFAAFISAISDVLLMYHPNLTKKYEDYSFLFDIDARFNFFGWLIGMFFLPLLYLGYKGTKEIADPDSKASLEKNDWVVVFLISLGCVVHSIYHFVPVMTITHESLEIATINSCKLVEVLFVSFYIMFCTIVTIQSLKKKNTLLFANRFFNPLLWMILAAIIFIITPKYGGYLAVSSFNMSIAFYFVGIIVNKKKLKKVTL